jgi:hypothetical protein
MELGAIEFPHNLTAKRRRARICSAGGRGSREDY